MFDYDYLDLLVGRIADQVSGTNARIQQLDDKLDRLIARLDQQNAHAAITSARYARILDELQQQGQDGNARPVNALRAQEPPTITFTMPDGTTGTEYAHAYAPDHLNDDPENTLYDIGARTTASE